MEVGRALKIPFDSVVLSAVLSEVQAFVGGFVQGIRQPDEDTVCLGLYKRSDEESAGGEAMLLLCVNPTFARAHFITKRPPNQAEPPVFCATLRARIEGAQLKRARQIANDRVLELWFESSKGDHRLICEIMGKHSNLILTDEDRRIVAALKWVGPDKSSRPIKPNGKYTWPPVLDLETIGKVSATKPRDWKQLVEGAAAPASPFFRKLLEAESVIPESWEANLAVGIGAYPLPIIKLGFEALSRSSISVALEQHYSTAVLASRIEAQRSVLLGQLDRVLLAREVALSDLKQTQQSGLSAGKWQRFGELTLAYGSSAPAGSSLLNAWDYDGSEVSIKLDPELDFKENANRYFDKAKKAKGRSGLVADQIARLEGDRLSVEAFREKVLGSARLDELLDLQEEAKQRRWLSVQKQFASKEDRPYEGHRIRELLGPGGVRVLFGENAESNDYLTLRVAKPNDMWLHVRGSTSAHVVILTGNKPEKINKEHLEFAAKVAVQHSTSKHAGYVPVDYTLRKYVRRPRGAAKGAAIYTHEKTLHIES